MLAVVECFERGVVAITLQACRENALRFASERFQAELTAFVEREWVRRWPRSWMVGKTKPSYAD